MIGSERSVEIIIGCWTFDIQRAKEDNESFVNLRVFESCWQPST